MKYLIGVSLLLSSLMMSAQDSLKHPIDIFYEMCASNSVDESNDLMCADEYLKLWDQEVKKYYLILSNVLNPLEFEKLENSQNKWTSFREAEKEFIEELRNPEEEGNEFSTKNTIKSALLAKDRAIQLMSFFDDWMALREGDINLSHQYLTHFTDKPGVDTFKLVLSGTDILRSKVHFYVIGGDGTQMYKTKISTSALADYGYNPVVSHFSRYSKEAYMLYRFYSFFKPESFTSAGQLSSIKWSEKEMLAKENFEEILNDPSRRIFYYSVYEETGFYIAYSKLTGRIEIFTTCC